MKGNIKSTAMATLAAYKTFAIDSEKSKLLVQDSAAVQFLVYLLESDDVEILLETVHILNLIATECSNRARLLNIFGVKESIEVFLKKPNLSEELNTEVHKLSCHLKTPWPSNQPHYYKNVVGPDSPHSKGRLMKVSASKAKVVVLDIEGLVTSCDRQSCETHLLRIKGMISITFNLAKSRCVCRVKREILPAMLGQAISNAGYNCSQVLKDTEGNETKVPLTNIAMMRHDHSSLPEYLPEEDSPAKSSALIDPKSHVKSKEGGWISAATNFLQRSFFW